MTKEKLTLRNCSFAFECKANWNDLTKLPDEKDVRFCSECQKNVYYCKSDSALARHVKLNHCVAIDADPYRTRGKVEFDERNFLIGDIYIPDK